MNRETSILWTEITDFPKDWGIKKHFHKNYFHLFYFVKGTGAFLIGDQEYRITPGSCFLLPPGIIHGLSTSTVDELVSYEIKFRINDPRLSGPISQEVVLNDPGDFFRTCVEFIQKNGLSHNPEKMDLTNHFLCALLTEIAEKNGVSEQKDSELIDTSHYSSTVVSVITYVEENYMHHIYLDEIAQHIDYNRNYMCSLFKKETGITVVDYVNYVRIRKACEYIIYSDIGFPQICLRVGFLNLSHFNRTFKKLVGTTPSAYSRMGDLDDNNLFPKNADEPETQSAFPTLEQALKALHIGTEE